MEPFGEDKIILTVAELTAMADLMDDALQQIIRLNEAGQEGWDLAKKWRERAVRVAHAWRDNDAAQLEAHATNIFLWLWSEEANSETELTNEPEEGQ